MNNDVKLQGNIIADPVFAITKKGNTVANLTLAVQRTFPREGADFIRCTLFKEVAESIKELRKGSVVKVQGSLCNDTYEKDGKKHYNSYVLVHKCELA